MKKLVACLIMAILISGLIGAASAPAWADSVDYGQIELAVAMCISSSGGQTVEIVGFGTFQVKHRSSRGATCVGSLESGVTPPDSAEIIRMDQDGALWIVAITPADSNESSVPHTVFLINGVKLQ